jgi:hypothetical protein
MNLRRRLFGIWCGLSALWWLIAVFGGDGRLILLKFQIGGWRAAYVHFVVTALIAVAVPAVMLLIGRLFSWSVDRFSEKPRPKL